MRQAYQQIILWLIISVFSISAFAAILRDPTKPSDYSGPLSGDSTSGLELMAIVISSKNRFAIINNQNVSVGDHIGDNFILRIIPNQVEVRNSEGEVFTLYLFHETVKQQDFRPINRTKNATAP